MAASINSVVSSSTDDRCRTWSGRGSWTSPTKECGRVTSRVNCASLTAAFRKSWEGEYILLFCYDAARRAACLCVILHVHSRLFGKGSRDGAPSCKNNSRRCCVHVPLAAKSKNAMQSRNMCVHMCRICCTDCSRGRELSQRGPSVGPGRGPGIAGIDCSSGGDVCDECNKGRD